MKSKFAHKVIAFATAAITIFGGVVPAFAAPASVPVTPVASTTPLASSAFSDTSHHWGQNAIEKWSGYSVVQGYNGSFRPDAPVTRAEYSSMIDNIMKYIELGDNRFSDLGQEKWYYNAMLKLNTAGVLKGTDGKALPNNKITRQEAAVLIAGAFETGNAASASSSGTAFSDHAQIADWADEAVQSLVSKSVISGMPDGTFRPAAPLTRAEAVTMFDKLIQTLITAPGEYSQDVVGNVVVNTSGATLKNMKITGDLYVAQGVGEGEVTLDNVKITGNVHVQGGGENSILFNNVDVKGALIVNKYNGKVRVLATGSTSVSITLLESGAMLVTKELTGGGFETVEISADVLAGQEVKLDGNFNKVVNKSAQVKITGTGTIKELVADVTTHIAGTVTIDKITKTGNAEVTLENNTPQPSSTATPVNNSGGSGGGSAGGGGSTDGGSQTVSVKGISLDVSALSMVVGESKTLKATIAPVNATNQKVLWTIAGGGMTVLEVNGDGVISAKSPGTAKVIATSEDGGFTAETVVKVEQPALGVKVSKYEGVAVDRAAVIEETVIANSANVTIVEAGRSLIQAHHYDTSVTALAPMKQTTVGHAVYAVITLQDLNGKPLTDTTGVGITVNGATYGADYFGRALAEGFKAGSFVLPLNAGQPESIRQYKLEFTQAGYVQTSLTVTYRPAGTPIVKAIGAISGSTDIGSELKAGVVSYEGTPANQELAYQWYRADSEQGKYTAISGANTSTYVLTPEDGNHYLRVWASADEIKVSGAVVSEAFGPVQPAVNAEEVFAAIEAAYLGSNKDKSNVTTSLTLPTSLPAYPGVTMVWSSSNLQVIDAAGKVTRGERDDQFVNLTVTLGGQAAGSRTYELTVRAAGTENVGIEGFIDPYFTANYPQAFIKDGTVHVRYALKAPAEVYMVVNTINGMHKSDVKAVLEGHAGIDNRPVYANQWPYFEVKENAINQVQEFDTGIKLSDTNGQEARVEFVIVDPGKNYFSSAVTTILFDSKVVSALDTYPPRSDMKYINRALDTIYVYYHEKLDLSSAPSKSDYTLSAGQVDAVTLFNEDGKWGIAPGYAKLSVSGITEADAAGLMLSYNGSAIRDLSDAGNQALPYTKQPVWTISEHFSKVVVSSDRKSLIAEIVPGWEPYVNEQLELYNSEEVKSRFAVAITGQGSYSPSFSTYSYAGNYLEFTLKFDTPLPEGNTTLTFDTTGIVNWAKDLYPAKLISESITQIEAPGTPSAKYNEKTGVLNLSFAPDFSLDYASLAAGLVLKVDGVEYALRGYILSRHTYTQNGQTTANTLDIRLNDQYSWKFKQAVDKGTDVQIKYTKVNGDHNSQISDGGGSLLPDFDYVTVVKKP
ncbi:S-layer homology domain-containing protein [Paenibacillus donghaensis]|uniref:SLH domain-containing protein n=1 Tax=Paenibacillus donghaensis TaxID=414771 RepID=A0A2Z2KUN6_9BACL|nr:S-layer homology domain-containing protein [Paenibacillus donghaensis]ASA25822.1 hypothetical protein B9T62_36895 [Paenibacillus donghaensis]